MANQDFVEGYRREYTNSSKKPDQNIDRLDNKFGVEILQYPSDLQTSPDLQHYILFNINARGKSEIDTSKRLFEVTRNQGSANLSVEQLSSNSIRGATYAAAGAAAGVAVTSLAKGAAKAFGKSGSNAMVAANTVGIAAAGGTALVMQTSNLLKPDTTYRIKDAIALHVDAPPTVKYSTNYANKELGTLLGVLSGGVMDNIKNLGGESGAALGASLAKLPGAFGAADVSSALGKSSGTALNPFKEVVFESVDFRSFSFKYKFFPKNEVESKAVYKIVTLFKEHMHPQLSDNKLFFIYPSEFQISYYHMSSENTYFHRFRPCALESMDVSYGGDQFSTFRDGNPTEVTLSLTFRELEILTRSMIREGY